MRQLVARTITLPTELRARQLTKVGITDRHSRVYLYHIRKAGGTSLIHMFLGIGGGNGAQVYAQLTHELGHRIITGRHVFVGWNTFLIDSGVYHFAFSHSPMHHLRTPKPGTFTVTCLRDPAERVLSHYRMLLQYQAAGTRHPCMRTEGPWMGRGFSDFLKRIPREHLMNQLYMFSARFDVKEAADNIIGLDAVLSTECFADGVRLMNERLGTDLEPLHVRQNNLQVQIDPVERLALREALEPEYQLVDRLRASHLLVP